MRSAVLVVLAGCYQPTEPCYWEYHPAIVWDSTAHINVMVVDSAYHCERGS